jgi:hypothetical protein
LSQGGEILLVELGKSMKMDHPSLPETLGKLLTGLREVCQGKASIGCRLRPLDQSNLDKTIYQLTGCRMSDTHSLCQLADSRWSIKTEGDQHFELGHAQIEALPVLEDRPLERENTF